MRICKLSRQESRCGRARFPRQSGDERFCVGRGVREAILPERQTAFHVAQNDGATGAHVHVGPRTGVSRVDDCSG